MMIRALSLAMTLSVARIATAQSDTVSLADLQMSAAQNDPRGRTIQLLQRQSDLRQQNMSAERLPSFALNGQAQYQSTTFKFPLDLPGVNLPTPKRDTYDAHIDAREQIFDPSLNARRSLERAQLSESQSRVNTSLYSLRQSVNDAYFTALLLQERLAVERTAVTDLEAQYKVAAARVREGTALPSEAQSIAAALISRHQSLEEIAANRSAALRILEDFTGRRFADGVMLKAPESDSNTRLTVDSMRSRPEFVQFRRARELLDAQRAVTAKKEMPRVGAFVRAGYGRPGLNPLATEFATYWVTGVQLDWAPFSWGSNARDRQALAIQSDIVANEEEAFRQALTRAIETDIAQIDRLERVTASDDSIVALRESILRETGARYAEAVITSAEYIDRQTDLLAARLLRATHRVELAQARVRLATTIGKGAR